MDPPTCHFFKGPSQLHAGDEEGAEGEAAEAEEEEVEEPTGRSDAPPTPKGDPVLFVFRKALKMRFAINSHMASG